MNTEQAVTSILAEILGIDTSRQPIDNGTRLLGGLPEFDSMAVISVLTAIEEHFDIAIDDDEVDAAIFETVGSLCAFVAAKVNA